MLSLCLKVFPSVLEMFLLQNTLYYIFFDLPFQLCFTSFKTHYEELLEVSQTCLSYGLLLMYKLLSSPCPTYSLSLKIWLQHYFSEAFFPLTYFKWVCCSFFWMFFFVIIAVAPDWSLSTLGVTTSSLW